VRPHVDPTAPTSDQAGFALVEVIRGAVGTFSQSTGGAVSGYSKRYVYDDRLRYISPPHFLDPIESAWHVQRETIE
jgi:hypothetical protein